ncbi:hypothetical protein RI054_32g126090 [Pseudoscourfieldia marina]
MRLSARTRPPSICNVLVAAVVLLLRLASCQTIVARGELATTVTQAPRRALLAVTHDHVSARASKLAPIHRTVKGNKQARSKKLGSGRSAPKESHTVGYVSTKLPKGVNLGWNEGIGNKMLRERRQRQKFGFES